jgi:general secretion pathway protein A
MRHYQHFGLKGPLFRVSTPHQPLYMSRSHREALAMLEWGLCHEPSAFTLLTGEPGTGKSTLLHSLLSRDYYQVRTASVSNPKLPFDQILRDVMRQLGIGAGPTKLEMLNVFERFLAAIEPGGRLAIIVDEAQALGDEALEEIRLLSNRRGTEENPLHFILIGQDELAQRLRMPGLHQLNDRIGARTVLDRMTRDEAFGYVDYCMRAGGGSARKVFDRRALARIVDHSGGLPRRLNVLCHNAMLMAYSAGRRNVDLDAARTVALEYENLFASRAARPAEGARRFWFWPSKPEPPAAISSPYPAAGAQTSSGRAVVTEI